MANKKATRQHYVPQLFLKNFTNKESSLNCLRRIGSEVKYLKNQSLDNVCVENKLYEPEFQLSEPELEGSLESALSKSESKLATCLLKTVNKLNEWKDSGYSKDTDLSEVRWILAILFAFIECRHPSKIKDLKRDQKDSWLHNHAENQRDLTSSLLDRRYYDGTSYLKIAAQISTIEDTENDTKSEIGKLAQFYSSCSIRVGFANPSVPLVGCDCPISCSDGTLQGTYWPISSQLAITFINDKKKAVYARPLNKKETIFLNDALLVDEGWTCAFCADEAPLLEYKSTQR